MRILRTLVSRRFSTRHSRYPTRRRARPIRMQLAPEMPLCASELKGCSGPVSGPTSSSPANGVDYGTYLTRPVETVSWMDATNYCALRTQQERAEGLIPTKRTPGLTYSIESSTIVSSAAWQRLINRTAPTNDTGLGVGVFELRDAILPSGQRF